MQTRYRIEPPIPANVETFDVEHFGQYQPRGFNPAAFAGAIRGVPIAHLDSPTSRWLDYPGQREGHSIVHLYGKDGAEVGNFVLPSAGCARFTGDVIRWDGPRPV